MHMIDMHSHGHTHISVNRCIHTHWTSFSTFFVRQFSTDSTVSWFLPVTFLTFCHFWRTISLITESCQLVIFFKYFVNFTPLSCWTVSVDSMPIFINVSSPWILLQFSYHVLRCSFFFFLPLPLPCLAFSDFAESDFMSNMNIWKKNISHYFFNFFGSLFFWYSHYEYFVPFVFHSSWIFWDLKDIVLFPFCFSRRFWDFYFFFLAQTKSSSQPMKGICCRSDSNMWAWLWCLFCLTKVCVPFWVCKHYTFLLDNHTWVTAAGANTPIVTWWRGAGWGGEFCSSRACTEPVPLNCDFHKSLISPVVGQDGDRGPRSCRWVFSSPRVEG